MFAETTGCGTSSGSTVGLGLGVPEGAGVAGLVGVGEIGPAVEVGEGVGDADPVGLGVGDAVPVGVGAGDVVVGVGVGVLPPVGSRIKI